jgi:ankyrin repeat protein
MNFQELKSMIIRDDAKALELAVKSDAAVLAVNPMQEGAFDINFKWGSAGFTPLMMAVDAGSLNCVKTLLKLKADVNIRSFNGLTAFMKAVNLGSKEIAQLLLDHDADINDYDHSGMNSLMKSSFDGKIKMVDFLIKKDAKLDSPDKKGFTALMYAASGEKEGCAELLINAKADIDAKDSWGNTVLMHTISKSQMEFVQFLIDKGANVNSQNQERLSPLSVACQVRQVQCVKVLLEAGASADAVDSNGQTILFHALGDNPEIFDLILDATSNIDHKDKLDQTPVMQAASDGYVEYMKILVFAGANVDQIDSSSQPRSVLTRIIMSPNILIEDTEEAVKFLLSSGVSYKSELDAHVQSNMPDRIVEILKKAKSIDDDASLSYDAKKLTKAFSFSSAWSTDAEFHDCSEKAKIKVVRFLEDQEVNIATKIFVLKNSAGIDASVGSDFKAWDLKKMGSFQVAINLAFLHGNKIDGLRELCFVESDKLKSFVDAIPLNSHGGVCEYSVGEYFNGRFLDAIYHQAVRGDALLGGIPKNTMSRISSFLSNDDIKFLRLQNDEEGDAKEDANGDTTDTESESESYQGVLCKREMDPDRKENDSKRSRGAQETEGTSDESSVGDDFGFLHAMEDDEIDKVLDTGASGLLACGIGGFFDLLGENVPDGSDRDSDSMV